MFISRALSSSGFFPTLYIVGNENKSGAGSLGTHDEEKRTVVSPKSNLEQKQFLFGEVIWLVRN
jgi:hypothetical protein